ncbi:MAG TPA: PDZ domain-containing protein [Ignavibacteriaceae bacterium]|nr:PDZ domain-containing protein [Ignavibacteriaceae bacterium]
MKKYLPTFIFIILILAMTGSYSQQRFYLNFKDRSSDLFTVTLIPEQLSHENQIYQFASTAPGTYETMNIGRFVKSFKAYNEDGKEIETKQQSVNQWLLSNPEEVRKIIYEIDDTWDYPMDSNWIYPMCGSAVDSNYVVINGQCVFGYFHGMQSEPIDVKLEYPDSWTIGTALPLDDDGYYEAEDYDQIVDSPMMLGKLTKATAEISGADIDIYTYSKTGLLQSNEILKSVKDILNAEDKFTDGLPVNHYTFLFHFENLSVGAWEHSYSSFYVFREDSLSRLNKQGFENYIAHEFFHIVTPLNIHSELVEKFNFEKPVMSKHLWLYEGVTEWASQIMLLRDSLMPLEQYEKILQRKMNQSESFDKNLSLTYLGEHSTELKDQYLNIYAKGALVAGLLDIRLLQLSGGKKGLRELINELAGTYGPHHSFSEKTFFDDLVKMTYPEIRDFIDRYIAGAEPLPVKEYYNKIGINYLEQGSFDSSNVSLGIQIGFDNGNFIVAKIDEDSPNYSIFKTGDVIHKVEGQEVTMDNIQEIITGIRKTKKGGDSLKMTVLRNNMPVDLNLILEIPKQKNIFSVNEKATAAEVSLRNIWLKNL